MSPTPHFFGLDFSSALPWVLTGLLLGLAWSFFWRLLTGGRVGAGAEARLNEVASLLDAQRGEHQTNVTRLIDDARNFQVALADAERRASAASGRVPELQREVERLRKADLATRDELLAATRELERFRGGTQWSETQVRAAAEDRQRLEKELGALKGQHQSFSADLATARVAAELKDSEIARLINQLQWHEVREAAQQQDKQPPSAGFTGFKSGGGVNAADTAPQDILAAQSKYQSLRQDHDYTRNIAYWGASEIERLRALVSKLESDVAAASSALEARARDMAAAQASYGSLRQDHDYTRNIASWGASEIARLRALVTTFEGDAAVKRSALALLEQQAAARGKARFGGARGIVANGASSGVRLNSQGAGKGGLASQRIAGMSPVLSRAKASKLGKAIKLGKGRKSGTVLAFASGSGTSAFGGGRPGLLAVRSKSQPQIAAGDGEIAALRAKVSALAAEAETFRRYRDALAAANRIAGTQG